MSANEAGRPPPGRSDGPGVTRPQGRPVESAADVTDGSTVPDPCDLAGHLDREAMYVAGYVAGFEAGEEVGEDRLLRGIEHALPGGLARLLDTDLLRIAGARFAETYRRKRALELADPTELCPAGRRAAEQEQEHACSRCTRVEARQRNRRLYGGSGDFPGVEALRRSA